MSKLLENLFKDSITWGNKVGNSFYDQQGEMIDFIDKEIRSSFRLSQYHGSNYSVQWSVAYDRESGKTPNLEYLYNLLKSNFHNDFDFKYKLYGKGDLRLVINKQKGFISEIVITPKNKEKFSTVLKLAVRYNPNNTKLMDVLFELNRL
jgi:hypothetical protein